jgi:hypothetical protein
MRAAPISRILTSSVTSGSITLENRTQPRNRWRSVQAFRRLKPSGAWTKRSTTREPPTKPDVLQSSLGSLPPRTDLCARCRMVGGHARRPSPRHLGAGALHFWRPPAHASHLKEVSMLRDVVLWLAGVPIFVIILLHLFGVFH